MKTTVRQIVEPYISRLSPVKRGGYKGEVATLRAFLRESGLANTVIGLVTTKEISTYRDKRYNEVKSTTVAHEIRLLHNVFQKAIDEGGFPNYSNPFKVKLKNVMFRRARRLLPGELEKLIESSQSSYGKNKIYIPLAIYLALETGMRMDEIFNLRWEDFNHKTRRIRIRKSKTDHHQDRPGRIIVMSAMAAQYANTLFLLDDCTYPPKANDLVFGKFTKHAFELAFQKVRKRAGLTADDEGETLEFRDLRREAASRWEDAGLTRAENDLMRGLVPKHIRDGYIRGDLNSIEKKLDDDFMKRHDATSIEDALLKCKDIIYHERDPNFRKGLNLSDNILIRMKMVRKEPTED
jgi:integrase